MKRVTGNNSKIARRTKFGLYSYVSRILLTLFVVLVTYNPYYVNYIDWAKQTLNQTTDNVSVLSIITFGVLLLLIWTILIKSTLRSLGKFGIIGLSVFIICAALLSLETISFHFTKIDEVIFTIEIIISFILGTGLSWSHIRRRISGQVDVSEIDSHE